MSDLTRLLEISGRVIPPVFEDIVELQRRRSHRARAVAACGLAVVLTLVVVTLIMPGSAKQAAPAPPAPKPSPTREFLIPGGQQTIAAKIRPGDVRGWKVLATLTNSQRAHRGATDLSITVNVHSDAASGANIVSTYCRAHDDDTWFVTNRGEGNSFQPCLHDGPISLRPTTDIPPFTSRHFPETASMRMYVTRLTPAMEACHRRGRMDCEARYGVPQPLATTDADFGFRIYEHRAARHVLRFWDEAFEALSTIHNTPWIIDRAVLAAPGAARLAVALPDSDQRRLVGLYQTRGPGWDSCIAEHQDELPAEEPYPAYLTAAEAACGVELRLRLDDVGVDSSPDDDVSGFGDPWTYVPAGAAHHVTVDVVGDDPSKVRYAVVVRSEQR